MDEAFRLEFSLRGFHGSVRVSSTINDDPARWGYHLLGIDQAIVDAAHGHPVVQATVDFPAQGYAAELAWIQLVWHTVATESTRVICDVAPQMVDSG
jgi:hypothetical protein